MRPPDKRHKRREIAAQVTALISKAAQWFGVYRRKRREGNYSLKKSQGNTYHSNNYFFSLSLIQNGL